jgi:hypothetical protein
MENRYLVDFGLEGNFVCGEFQGKFAGRVGGKKAERGAIVDNPVGAGGEEASSMVVRTAMTRQPADLPD